MRTPSFLRDKSGVAAIEFAILAPLFLTVLFSTFEVGWLVTKATLLDRALDLTIRQIRIAAIDRPKTQAEAKSLICNQMWLVSSCMSSLTVEMTTIRTAADIPDTAATCVDRKRNIAPVVAFTPNKDAEIVYVRACLVSDALTPFIGIALYLPLDSEGGYSLVSSSAFMNEPGA